MKAILIGNGVTSQMIPEYRDEVMIEKFKKVDVSLYNELNGLLNPLRVLECKNQDTIVLCLKQQGLHDVDYHQYFIEQQLLFELSCEKITNLETLLKVAHLFSPIKEVSYKEIERIANRIYFNDGNNGISAVTKTIDKKKFKALINRFDMVFTTNFDNVLDDVHEKEVYHLHGGFFYEKTITHNNEIHISKSGKVLNPSNAHLIWGRNAKEKHDKTKGGFRFPISFPMTFGSSVLEGYYSKLKSSYTELFIWGYSGLNDGHINTAIKANTDLQIITVYVSPNEVDEKGVLEEKVKLFGNAEKIRLASWDELWGRVYK